MKKRAPLYGLLAAVVAGIVVAFVFRSCTRGTENPSSETTPAESPSHESASSAASSSPEANLAPAAPPKAQVDRNPETYQRYLSELIEKLPKVADLQRMSSEQLHHTPPGVLAAAKDFVKVMDSAAAAPELAPLSQKFFHDCASRDDIATSLRATCLVNLRELFVKGGGKRENFDLSPYAPELQKLAEGF